MRVLAGTLCSMAVTETPRLGLPSWSASTDPHPDRSEWDAQQHLLDSMVAIDLQVPTWADRPAASVRGQYMWVEADRNLWRSTGTGWELITRIGGGGGGLPVKAGGSGTEGSSLQAARADHTHPLPLATGSAHGGMSSSDKAKLDAATSSGTANTLPLRDASGRTAFNSVGINNPPTSASDAARKDYVDAVGAAVLVPTSIPANANLNTYVTSGVFIQRTTSQASTALNYPVGRDGLLEVFTELPFVYQRYTVSSLASGAEESASFKRSRYNGVWGVWRQDATTVYADGILAPVKAEVDGATYYAQAGKIVERDNGGRARFEDPINGYDAANRQYVDAADAVRVPFDTNLGSGSIDDVRDVGYYYQTSAGPVTTGNGYPRNGVAGSLLVTAFGSATGGYRIQEWTEWSTHRRWIRSTNSSSSWSHDWRELAGTETATSSADGLMPRADKALIDTATTSNVSSALVQRDSNSQINVPGTPTSNWHATSRSYVLEQAKQSQVMWLQSLGSQDLNDLMTEADTGLYRQGGSAAATDERHYPVNLAGFLEVFMSTNMAWQRYTTYGSTSDVYVRGWYQGTWGPWRRLVNDSDRSTSAVPLTIPSRDSSGMFAVRTPTASDHPTTKAYVDSADSALDSKYAGTKTTVDNATTAATGSRLALRDSSGRVSVGTPTVNAHAATKAYVDSADSSISSAVSAVDSKYAGTKTTVDNATTAATAGRLVTRSTAGQIIVPTTPTATTHSASKAYVDSADSALDSKYASTKDLVDKAGSALPVMGRDTLVRRDSSGRFQAREPSAYGDVATKGYVDPALYKSGTRRANGSAMIGPGGSMSASRVGYTVTLSFDDWSGSLAGTGAQNWQNAPSALTLPAGLRPDVPQYAVGDGSQRWRIMPDGTVDLWGPSVNYTNAVGTVSFVVSSEPPSSFTWGTAV